MGYKHWSTDICKLIVDLFIRGIDIDDYKYFSLSTIEEWCPQAKQLIKGIELSNSKPDGFRIAINWLVANAKNIFPQYEQWEFQLGLALQFLKSSYKTMTLPPGKRVVCILSACSAIIEANNNIKEYVNNRKDNKK